MIKTTKTARTAPTHPAAAALGQRLSDIREALCLTRPKLDSKLGVPATSIKNWELGYRECPMAMAAALLEFVKPELQPQYLRWFLGDIRLTPQAEDFVPMHALNPYTSGFDALKKRAADGIKVLRVAAEYSRPRWAELLDLESSVNVKSYELGYRTTTFELLCRVFESADRSDQAVLWIRYILLGKSTSSAPAELLAEQLKYQKLKAAQAA